jgi:hypothetical protein
LKIEKNTRRKVRIPSTLTRSRSGPGFRAKGKLFTKRRRS